MLGTAPQRWGKRPRSFAHSGPSEGKEGGLWPLWGLKQVAVLCVPSWGVGQAACHGNCPSASEERGRCGLSGLAWRLCSLLTDFGPLPHSPSLAVPITFPRQAEPHVRAGYAGDAGGGRCGSQRRVKDGVRHFGVTHIGPQPWALSHPRRFNLRKPFGKFTNVNNGELYVLLWSFNEPTCKCL